MNKHHYLLTLFIAAMLCFSGCKDNAGISELPASAPLTITASMPQSGNPATRVTASQKDGSRDIELRWDAGDKIQLYFKQGEEIIEGDEVTVTNISEDGKRADFTVNVPEGITGTFDLYGVHGAPSAISGGSILLPGDPPSSSHQPINEIIIPIYFKAPGLDESSQPSVAFQHYGALEVITVKNTSNDNLTPTEVELFGSSSWFYDKETTNTPVFDVVSGTVSMQEINLSWPSTTSVPSVLAPGDNRIFARWVMPDSDNPPPEIRLKMAPTDGSSVTSANSISARTDQPLVAGHAYHLYALWGGTSLDFTDEAGAQADVPQITMTTTMSTGNSIALHIDAATADRDGVWIDLNGNGVKDSGEGDINFGSYRSYTLGAHTITIYGKVTSLHCSGNLLSALDVSGATALTTLNCQNNSLTALDVSKNTALTYLDCSDNSLTALDVSGATALTSLYCSFNSLTALDVSGATALTTLNCYNNSLTTLDVSGATALRSLDCSYNSLTELDVSGATALTYLYCYSNRIYGPAMDDLISSLRMISPSTGYIMIINPDDFNEQNICTTAQVDGANAKGWHVQDSWGSEYTGS